jgi:hypothetical protein
MLSELHSLNLKFCSKQYNKNFVLHLIVVPQLSSGRQHNFSTKTRQAGQANEQSMYSLMSMIYLLIAIEKIDNGNEASRALDYTRLERLDSDEHSSLLEPFVRYVL